MFILLCSCVFVEILKGNFPEITTDSRDVNALLFMIVICNLHFDLYNALMLLIWFVKSKFGLHNVHLINSLGFLLSLFR